MNKGIAKIPTFVCDFCQSGGATVINDEGFVFHPGCANRYIDQFEITRSRGTQPLTIFRRIFKSTQ